MVLSRKDEITDIFSFFLNEDCIRSILKIEKDDQSKESMEYWTNITVRGNSVCGGTGKTLVYSNNNVVIDLHSQIKRMNGDLKKIKEENDEIKTLEENNRLWADAYRRGIRY
jgi:hypothetical protein